MGLVRLSNGFSYLKPIFVATTYHRTRIFVFVHSTLLVQIPVILAVNLVNNSYRQPKSTGLTKPT